MRTTDILMKKEEASVTIHVESPIENTLVVLNWDDHAYFRVELHESMIETFRQGSISKLDSSINRCAIWRQIGWLVGFKVLKSTEIFEFV